MNHRRSFAIEVNGSRVRLGERTLIMGVLNVTPDSFSDGGLFLDPDRAIQHGLDMVHQGADWIDVGGESTRPGSKPISPEEELRRVLPVIRGLRKKGRTVPVSIDTTKAAVAEKALGAGASILNDVSGLRFDPHLAEVARRYNVPLILMHMRGRPETMQQKPFARSIWRSLEDGLARSIRRAVAAGVRRSQLIIDPGLGFGKSRRQNYEILAQLGKLQRFRLPILVGTSRKSFVQAVAAGEELEAWRLRKRATTRWPITAGFGRGALGASSRRMRTPLPLQSGDVAAAVASILAGAHIVRVHDVAAALPAVRIADAVLAASKK